jgi:hypothetical protein
LLRALTFKEPFATTALWAASNFNCCSDSRAVHYLINHDFFTQAINVILDSSYLLTTRLEAANVVFNALLAGSQVEIRQLVLSHLEIVDAILLSLKMFGQNNKMLESLLGATMLLLKIH